MNTFPVHMFFCVRLGIEVLTADGSGNNSHLLLFNEKLQGYHNTMNLENTMTLQWNLSWETTAMRDHLSFKKQNVPGRSFYISM